MKVFELDDPATIERYCRADPGLHIYELGDLDPFFWPHTRWFAVGPRTQPSALALLYTGTKIPSLLALCRAPSQAHVQLLADLGAQLPEHLYAHLGPGLADALAPGWTAEHHGHHHKMVLRDHARVDAVDGEGLEPLGVAMLGELLEFYARSYPGNWFDARMLDTGMYLGLRRDGALACVAGVQVYAPAVGVAALGNITTAPEQRGRGLARRVVAGLCRQLRAHVETIGLNVHADNHAAIRCYEQLGFEVVGGYDEYTLTRR